MSDNPWNANVPWQPANIWVASDAITGHMARQIHGSVSGWHEYACSRYLWPALPKWSEKRIPTVERFEFARTKFPTDYQCLVLGSTEGGIENILWDWGFVGDLVVLDIAEKAMARQQEAADRAGRRVSYRAADLNSANIDGRYDIIVATGILHHLIGLERCIAQLQSALTDDGLIFANEFTGPYRFQLPPAQVRWINHVLALAPPDIRISDVPYSPPSEAHMIAQDPSEAISGQRLDAAFTGAFDVLDRALLGGTITTYMHEQIDYRLTNATPHRQWMNAVLQLEHDLIAAGVITSDYAFYVGRKKSPRRRWW